MTSETESRALAEESREAEWRGDSFIRDLFMGRFRLDLFESVTFEEPSRPEFLSFYRRLETFLREEVDPVEIDRTGEYPQPVIDRLAELGAFGMKIPTEYGGLGFSHPEYVRTMELVGSYDGNIAALLSAHQAIGVPQPVRLFGTEEQKKRFLPRCARGAISAFALTEPAVGSDPARLETIAEPIDGGRAFRLYGEKLWCTNGTLAELLVVMARDSETNRIHAFVVETDQPGVRVDHRCHFMGLHALANAALSFDGVVVPRENLIGPEGHGLKVALVTLNTGRLTLPAATAGAAKQCLEIVRKWSTARVQWGRPIGEHEAIAHLNVGIATRAFAMESVAALIGELADRDDFDIRLEAAAAKEWNTVQGYSVINDTLQVRGGRGFETERSLSARGEPAIGVERALRDSRINLIFEGSSEIMHLFMAREAVDPHLALAGHLVDPRVPVKTKLASLPGVMGYYALWYPRLWLGWSHWPRYASYGRLGKHLRFAERSSKRLARALFHAILRHGAGLEHRQKILFRLVDVALEIYVMSATICHARALTDAESPRAKAATELADLFSWGARRRIKNLFSELRRNEDVAVTRSGRALLDGRYQWLEEGAIGVPYSTGELVPMRVKQILERREEEEKRREEEERRAG